MNPVLDFVKKTLTPDTLKTNQGSKVLIMDKRLDEKNCCILQYISNCSGMFWESRGMGLKYC